jgi:ribonuclease HI
LQNYLVTLQNLPKGNMMIDRKGKAKLDISADLRAGANPIETKKEEAWVRPPNGWVKCNVDASFIDEDRNGAWGAVLRDSNGTILFSAWNTLSHCQSASEGEAIAYLEGLKLAIAYSDSNIIIETDCAYILDSFKEGSPDRSKVCLIAKEFNYMKPPDRQVIISKVNRLCNKVAHGLCQLSRSELCSGVLQGAVPTCVSKAALDDCNQNLII